jgi:DNA-binding winged helix-turn-helix (wHTH) protein/Tol biopolymer transport system component
MGQDQVVRFGVFQVDLRTGELRRGGIRVRLQSKPFKVLQALLDKGGQLVTREELKARLWPDDTFVDFDNGLNTAVKRLRSALNDSAENPQFVETLAGAGYRFIGNIAEADPAGPQSVPAIAVAPAPVEMPRRVSFWAGAGLALLAAGASFAIFRPSPPDSPVYRQITYRRGQISGARFTPGGKDIIYSAAWDNGPRRTFVTNVFTPDARVLGFPGGFPGARVASVSPSAELALLTSPGTAPIGGGDLFRVPMNGNSPAAVAKDVMAAEWSPAGPDLVLVKAEGGETRIVIPPDRVLYRSSGAISSLRVSPDGRQIAFFDHPVRHDNAGDLKTVDRNGVVNMLSAGWADGGGVAWHPLTNEIWFTAAPADSPKALWAVRPGRKARLVTRGPGTLSLKDIAVDGRVLLSRDTRRLEISGWFAGEKTPRNLSLLDWSRAQDISDSGEAVLFDEYGEGAAGRALTYLYRAGLNGGGDGSTTRLGEGLAMAISPDGRRALVLDADKRTRLRLLPIGPGQAQDIPETGVEYQWARFYPAGDRLIALGNEKDKPLRLYVVTLEGTVTPLTASLTTRNVAVSPDGKRVAALTSKGLFLYAAMPGSGEPQRIPSDELLAPVTWSADARTLFVQNLSKWGEAPTRLSRVDVASGAVTAWKTLSPPDLMGVDAVTRVLLAREGEVAILTYRRSLSELFVVDGLRE